MSEEEITSLAREYAEECAEEVGVMFNPQNWACSHCEIEAKDVIQFLLRRYCLVEKSKLGKDGLDIAWRAKEYGTVILSSDNVYYLFPDLGKEVEG